MGKIWNSNSPSRIPRNHPYPMDTVWISTSPGAPINKVKLANHRRQAMQETQETSLSTVSKPIRTCSCCCFCYDCRCTSSITHPANTTLLERTASILEECTAATGLSDNSSISTKSINFVCSTSNSSLRCDDNRRYFFGTVPVHSSAFDGDYKWSSRGGSSSSSRGGDSNKKRIGLVTFWQRIIRWGSREAYDPASNSTVYSNPEYCLGATLKL